MTLAETVAKYLTRTKSVCGTSLISILSGIVFVAVNSGFDWKDWAPTDLHDLYRVVPIFIVGTIVGFIGINTQDPSSKQFVRDALSIFQQVLSEHPDVLKPEVKQAMETKLIEAKPSELPKNEIGK